MCRRVRLHASCVTPRVLPGVTETQTNPCNVFPEEASIFIRRRWKSTHFFKHIQPNTLYVQALYIESSIQLLVNRKIYIRDVIGYIFRLVRLPAVILPFSYSSCAWQYLGLGLYLFGSIGTVCYSALAERNLE